MASPVSEYQCNNRHDLLSGLGYRGVRSGVFLERTSHCGCRPEAEYKTTGTAAGAGRASRPCRWRCSRNAADRVHGPCVLLHLRTKRAAALTGLERTGDRGRTAAGSTLHPRGSISAGSKTERSSRSGSCTGSATPTFRDGWGLL